MSYPPPPPTPDQPGPDPQRPGYWPDPQQPGYQSHPQQPGYYPDPPATQPYQAGDQTTAPAYPAPGFGPPAAPAPPGYGYPPYGYGYPAPAPTNGLAIASLVCSLAGLAVGISAPVGAILGHVARRQIRERGEQGDGMALAGIIVGWILTGLIVLCIAGYAVAIGWAISQDSNSF